MAEAALKRDAYIYSSPLPETYYEPEATPQAVPQTIPRAVPKPAFRPRISAFSIIGFLFIAFLAVFCIYSQIELTRISAEVTGVKAVPPRVKAQTGISERLNAQLAENNALHLEYERVFDLKEIEFYATTVLGMVKSPVAVENAEDFVKPDKAVIPASAQSPGGIKGFFEAMTEYFS